MPTTDQKKPDPRYVYLLVHHLRSGRTIRELADLSGIKVRRLERLMNGEVDPRPKEKDKLAEIFGVTKVHLFRRDGYRMEVRPGAVPADRQAQKKRRQADARRREKGAKESWLLESGRTRP